VTEQLRMMAALAEGRVLDAIRWAFMSAVRRTAADYDEDTGHDALWVGVNRYVLFRDRLDRVFSLGRYVVADDAEANAGLDVVTGGLTDEDIRTMPQIAPGLVTRSDVKGSPGWQFGGIRWLLSSAPIGEVNGIDWSRKSPVKQRAASQPDPDAKLVTLLHLALDDEVAAELLKRSDENSEMDIPTLIVAHAQDVDTDRQQLILGLPSHASETGDSWAWRQNLLGGRPPEGGVPVGPPAVSPDDSGDVADAPVRLRPNTRRGDSQSGNEGPRAAEGS
jgi:hypothetical protein